MHKRHDGLTKRLLLRIYQPCGVLTEEQEISPDAQRFDGYLIPGPDLAAYGDDLLYRLGALPCAFEAFHHAPSVDELVECVRKLLNARHVFALAKPPKPLPHLWILCGGVPRTGLVSLSATPDASFPPGVYQAPPALSTGLLVLSQLPETRETLLLRLMGAGETLAHALAELARLPDGAREREIAVPVLLDFRVEIASDPAHSPEDEEFLMQTADIVQQIRNEGRREGRDEGVQGALLGVYRARFGAVPPALATAVERTHDAAVLTAWVELFATHTADEITAALTSKTP